MINKILKITFIYFFLASCGYTPIFSNSNNNNINVNVVSSEGDKDLNILITQQLNRYKSDVATKNYDIKIISNYNKIILSKDTAGNATNYRVILNVNFETSQNSITNTFNYEETFDFKKENTSFEEENYEKLIKKDTINIIVQKLIFQLL